MKINKKRLKKLVQKPKIRPRVIESLTAFDENINNEKATNLNVQTETSDTVDLLKLLVNKMKPNHTFKVNKEVVAKHFLFNKKSLNFNFAALHQLKLIKVDWKQFKATASATGKITSTTIYRKE